MSGKRSSGFSLIEMVIAIVIIGTGLAGVLSAYNTVVKSSADPLIHKQMLAVAEEVMEEILLKPFAPNGTVPVNASTVCGVPAAVRLGFDDVADYHGYQTVGICDIEGTTVSGLEPYELTVTVAASAGLGAILSSDAKKITVAVKRGAAETLTLVGWRTWYACETGCTP